MYRVYIQVFEVGVWKVGYMYNIQCMRCPECTVIEDWEHLNNNNA